MEKGRLFWQLWHMSQEDCGCPSLSYLKLFLTQPLAKGSEYVHLMSEDKVSPTLLHELNWIIIEGGGWFP